VLFLAVGVLAIIFGILSIYDYFKLRAGKSEEVKLQLPRFLKRRIHTDIREKMKISNYIIGAGIVGFLVSISEFVCTGQVYLPTIMFVAEVPSLRIKALAYLFLYNIAFIIPLVIVFVLAYKGTSSDKLNLFWKKHTKSVKLITSVLFFILGGLLIFYSQ
jgi:cytochrome c biogenesis protein CcdA